ncbi:barH-like 2 homeobox protein isoform X2 [Sphaerodactylus townsendi]|uniref:barH-like 2 homeobox protein isoform X2 n=1 Tax=Sphaerodactylus townsendi TaxID=933632 RepID=UPI00202631E9|nr:barH-like 2 homeobox protein isoform X2 [Sphaerodactylus townsendi]
MSGERGWGGAWLAMAVTSRAEPGTPRGAGLREEEAGSGRGWAPPPPPPPPAAPRLNFPRKFNNSRARETGRARGRGGSQPGLRAGDRAPRRAAQPAFRQSAQPPASCAPCASPPPRAGRCCLARPARGGPAPPSAPTEPTAEQVRQPGRDERRLSGGPRRGAGGGFSQPGHAVALLGDRHGGDGALVAHLGHRGAPRAAAPGARRAPPAAAAAAASSSAAPPPPPRPAAAAAKFAALPATAAAAAAAAAPGQLRAADFHLLVPHQGHPGGQQTAGRLRPVQHQRGLVAPPHPQSRGQRGRRDLPAQTGAGRRQEQARQARRRPERAQVPRDERRRRS